MTKVLLSHPPRPASHNSSRADGVGAKKSVLQLEQ